MAAATHLYTRSRLAGSPPDGIYATKPLRHAFIIRSGGVIAFSTDDEVAEPMAPSSIGIFGSPSGVMRISLS
jgi:hypothetical protein